MKETSREIVIYQTKSGAIELKGDFGHETIWATQAQIVDLFDVDQSVVSRHIKNIFKDREIESKSNMQKMHNANSDKPVVLYSLDVVLGVGYRTNSKVAIEFRKWATKTLKQHVQAGYTINKNRITKNYKMFLKAVEDVKYLLPKDNTIDSSGILELVEMFASTWLSLDAYDKSDLPTTGFTYKQVSFTVNELSKAILELKEKVKSNIFGIERNVGGLEGIVGNIFQSFDNHDVYPNIEEKAAHLLYFIVKDHPFVDGNKRSGAFAFVWFLKKSGVLNTSQMTANALTALTLLVAESNPKDKDRIVGLILQLLKK